jgi:hypothetical protein
MRFVIGATIVVGMTSRAFSASRRWGKAPIHQYVSMRVVIFYATISMQLAEQTVFWAQEAEATTVFRLEPPFAARAGTGAAN